MQSRRISKGGVLAKQRPLPSEGLSEASGSRPTMNGARRYEPVGDH